MNAHLTIVNVVMQIERSSRFKSRRRERVKHSAQADWYQTAIDELTEEIAECNDALTDIGTVYAKYF